MTGTTVPISEVADALVARLDRALREGSTAMARVLVDAGADLAAAAAHFQATGRTDRLALLRLRESVCHLDAGQPSTAFQHAHDAWMLVARRAPRPVQALVLTQLAACYEALGQLRGALRAIRRAEALLVGVFDEGAPQMFAVRAQLVHLAERQGEDATAARLRRDRSLEGTRALDDAQTAEHRARLAAVFLAGESSPTWALCYLRRWRNVHGQ